MIGTLIQASAAPQAVAQIIQAEQAGVPAIWATSGGIGGADLLPERAGFDPTAEYSDALLDELMVYGSEAEAAAGLGQWIKDGMGEVLAHPLLAPANREGSLASAFAAIARATRQVA
jgi:hypothetical protein